MISWLPITIAILGTAASIGVWCLCRWLDARMTRDDDKTRGVFRD